ncbi:MAG: tRNA ((37)-N6)-threonylcarbamoyltransferase complex ATPase subunit type 1 TsaE [Verrucomicrobiaceae bacterium]|nr:tRNA ((37)-N6)-threonylcarbamoyltransferase complex ATPase subunit type 1 TsaE [Verrucomicrobiaceae bacterium]
MSEDLTIELADEAATLALGAAVGQAAQGGAIVFLSGDLGAGKTTFCRGLLHGLGFSGAVKSPTYTLVEPYELPHLTIYHFDLYRLHDPQELEYMGVRDYFGPDNLCLVEWPERGDPLLPQPDISIDIQVLSCGRQAALTALTDSGIAILRKLN